MTENETDKSVEWVITRLTLERDQARAQCDALHDSSNLQLDEIRVLKQTARWHAIQDEGLRAALLVADDRIRALRTSLSAVEDAQPDPFSSLNSLAARVYELAESKGWHPDGKATTKAQVDDYVPKAISNLHGEVSELWEAYRRKELDAPCNKGVSLTCLEEELADIAIRCLDAAIKLGVDIGRAVHLKHEFNKTRPMRHGNKAA